MAGIDTHVDTGFFFSFRWRQTQMTELRADGAQHVIPAGLWYPARPDSEEGPDEMPLLR